MKWPLLFALVLGACAPTRADDAATIADVRAADDARVAAMVAADAGKLDTLLSDGLYYAHSKTLVENKSQQIAGLVTGRLIYRRIDYRKRDFTIVSPGVVLCTGRARVDVGSKRMIFLVDINFLAVWRLESDRWRLFAWQSRRNEDLVPLGPASEQDQAPKPTATSVTIPDEAGFTLAAVVSHVRR